MDSESWTFLLGPQGLGGLPLVQVTTSPTPSPSPILTPGGSPLETCISFGEVVLQTSSERGALEVASPILVAALGALVSLGIAWWGWRRERENRRADMADATADRALTERLALVERRFQSAAAYERTLQAIVARLLAAGLRPEEWRGIELGPFLQASAEMRLAFGERVVTNLDAADERLYACLELLDALGTVQPDSAFDEYVHNLRQAGDFARSAAKSELFGV